MASFSFLDWIEHPEPIGSRRTTPTSQYLVFKWLRDPRYKPPEVDVARFLPVEVLSELAAPEAPDNQIEIVLSNGHRVSVSGVFDRDAVSRLVRGLR